MHGQKCTSTLDSYKINLKIYFITFVFTLTSYSQCYLYKTVINVTLENSSLTVSEDVGHISICLTLSVIANGTERSFGVQINTENNTATGTFVLNSKHKYEVRLMYFY